MNRGPAVLIPEQVIQDLLPVSPNLVLAPETPVIILNRSRHTLEDKYDSRPYLIPSGYSRVAYGAAVLFKAHQVVMGTRNPYSGDQLSYIAILGPQGAEQTVDPAEECYPFTDEFLAEHDQIETAIGGPRQIFQTKDIQATMPGMGMGLGSSRHALPDLSQQATPEAEAAAVDALTPPDSAQNYALAEMQAHALEAEAEIPFTPVAGEPAPARLRRR